jgi:hypothetical protein
MPSVSSRRSCSPRALQIDRSPEWSRAISSPASVARAISATISSSDIGAVSMMRAPGGQCPSSAFGTSEPA